MENVAKLNEAFQNFTQASKSLQAYYDMLGERVQYLTQELEDKNAQLKSAISEVRESKDFLQAVLQSMGEAMIVLDGEGKISMINRAAEELVRSGAQQAAGRFFHELDIEIEESSTGTRLKTRGVSYDVILSRSQVSGPGDSVRGYVILIKDITRIKDLERQNERNQRLIAMGEMAAKIVHEIRSPLCSIELFSNMLSNDLRETEHSVMADGISTGINSLNTVLTNMLFFAKPQKPSLREVNLREAVEQSLSMLMPLIQIRGIELSKELSDGSVPGDLELIKQVCMNVILNALQAMSDSGRLELLMEEKDEYITLSVIDDGEGIIPENVEKIFDPFFSTKDRGTGLGLAITNKIMQSHGGLIGVYKNSGQGSTFCLSFPRKGHVCEEAGRDKHDESAGIEA